METNWVMQGADGIFVMSLVASVIVGILITFILAYSAGPHAEPLWLAAMISAGSGATIATVAHVLKEGSGLSIWQVMVFGAGCGALGVLAYSLSVTRREKPGSARQNPGTKVRGDFRSAREPWRVPRAGCRTAFSPPDFRQRKLDARRQEAAQQ
ncbi:MAG: hypothetical protein WCH98_08550 [Verrucomicrobiota bacterium]